MFYLVTGGSGSGKSAFAEQCIVEMGGERRVYVATMYPFDQESLKRIERHREMRKEKQFSTIECYTNLCEIELLEGTDVLLECMSNLVANEMYQEAGAGEDAVQAVMKGIHHLLSKARNLVVVTNEVFSDGITYDEETQRYLSYLGAVNQQMGELADRVTEVVYGIPLEWKTNSRKNGKKE